MSHNKHTFLCPHNKQVLLHDDLAVVRLPAGLKETMLHYDCLGADATPAFLRYHFRRTDIAHPCLGLDQGGCAFPTPGGPQGAASATTVTADDDGESAHPPASPAEVTKNALFLLGEVGKELGREAFGELVGLPLLPLEDGSLGRFLKADGETVFLCTPAERELLAGGGFGVGRWESRHRLLEDLNQLPFEAMMLLQDSRLHAATNVSVMEPRDLAGMLDTVFPEAWKGVIEMKWTPQERDVSAPELFLFVLTTV